MGNKIYIRTDKNGTKIYHDYTCTRCGGAGYSEAWRFTGMTCYKCGGTGKQPEPQVIKVYTPEYEAKLAEQRAKRHEKQRLQRVAELKEKLPEMLMEKGFNIEGKVYAATGDTYSIKDELKEAGAHWKPRLNSWIFTEPHPEYHTVEISWDEVMEPNFEGGWLDWKDINPSELIQSKLPKVEKPVSEYVGEVGKRLEAEVTLVDVFGFEVPSFTPWGGTDTKMVYKFEDASGNILVWFTTGYGLDAQQYPQGSILKIRGTVKEHSEYKGSKQTVLQRVKVA